MNTFLIWSHPIVQVVAVFLGAFAMAQGVKSFASRYGKKYLFQWKNHVKIGAIALVLWIFGLTGFCVMHIVFEATYVTGIHANIAWAIAGLSVFGLISGYILDKVKNQYRKLVLIHGICNTVLFVLVLINFYNGIGLARSFLFN